PPKTRANAEAAWCRARPRARSTIAGRRWAERQRANWCSWNEAVPARVRSWLHDETERHAHLLSQPVPVEGIIFGTRAPRLRPRPQVPPPADERIDPENAADGKPKFAPTRARPRRSLRAFNEGGGERVPTRRNDAALGDEAGDEARGGHVEAVIRNGRGFRHDAHGLDAAVGGAAGHGC